MRDKCEGDTGYDFGGEPSDRHRPGPPVATAPAKPKCKGKKKGKKKRSAAAAKKKGCKKKRKKK